MTRIIAAELGVEIDFRVVPDLTSTDPSDYGGNPALSIPSLETSAGVWFGALNVSRELARRSLLGRRLIWPEALQQPLLANAQELTLQAMSTEVSLIMSSPVMSSPVMGSPVMGSPVMGSPVMGSPVMGSPVMGSPVTGSLAGATPGGGYRDKLQARLQGCVGWLDWHAPAILEALPARDTSYLEVALFCLVTHLGFRGVLNTAPYANLEGFCEGFGARQSALSTSYRFDAAPAATAPNPVRRT